VLCRFRFIGHENRSPLMRILSNLFFLMVAASAFAAAESVLLVKVMKSDDKIIVQRRNGEQWMLTRGVGALSAYRYEGRLVVINSPSTFGGAGATLVIAAEGEEAPLFGAERISSRSGGGGSSVPMPVTPGEKVVAAMVLIGAHDPGSNVMTSFNRYQWSKNVTVSPFFTPALYDALIADLKAKAKPTTFSQDLIDLLVVESKAGTKDAKFTTSRPAAASSSGLIETTIDGEFNGWEGETIIKLSNGQVWQQTEYHYHYHYAYMPKVLIIATAGGYKAKVDGVSKAVAVTRLR
jgi:hypothetical protein